MSKENLTLGEYLDHLRQQRAKLDELISHIESTIGGPSVVPVAAAGVQRKRGPYATMTIIDAAMVILKNAGKPMVTADIVRLLEDGGLKSQSKSLYRTVYNTLNNRLDKGIYKHGNKWGLSEWQKQPELSLQK